jgi:hypothetical protein
VLPNAHDIPSGTPEFAGNRAVAGAIANDLCIPVSAIGSGAAVTARAAVPEAPIDEDGQAAPPENEIGLPGQLGMSSPAGDAFSPENRKEAQFSFRVTL